MKSLVALWGIVAKEFGDGCGVSTSQDVNTVLVRSNAEGVSFLTITLSNFANDFDRSLSDGFVAPNAFTGFRRRGGLPLFLGGFLEQVFDRSSGVLLENARVEAVFAVRQLSRLYTKILLDCTPERVQAAFDAFVECEQELQEGEREWTPVDIREFSRVANLLFGRVLDRVNCKIDSGELIPKHGPGATADRLVGNDKFRLSEWTERLEKVFPSSDYLIPNYRYYTELDRVQFLEPGAERPVRVISVPKTLKAPRIIAVEPSAMQYAQQAVSSALMECIEHDRVTKHFITFTDQVPNQYLAREGSRDGSLATLDLSEASDRVSNQLVKVLLMGHGHLSEAVQACRSTRADVVGHGVIPLTKFASMGSALTFPIESMVFLTIAFLGIEQGLGHRLGQSDVENHFGLVRVYGDDIIVPAEYAQFVRSALEHYCFKVNARKSHVVGRFRESCGAEYFRGHDVSVVKVRREFPADITDVPEVISMVALRNLFYRRGLRRTAEYLDVLIEKVLPHFPVGSEDSPGLVKWSDEPPVFDKWCDRRHIGLVRAYVPKYKYKPIGLDEHYALLKFFLKRGSEPFADRNHLERSGRPVAASIKLRWISPV